MRRILLDQGLAATAANILREAGWDAIHVRELSMHAASDSSIIDYAARESRVVITLDRDFPQILALTMATRPSVVFIRQQKLRAVELAELVTSIWKEYEHILEHGCVLKVSARGTRARLLPLDDWLSDPPSKPFQSFVAKCGIILYSNVSRYRACR